MNKTGKKKKKKTLLSRNFCYNKERQRQPASHMANYKEISALEKQREGVQGIPFQTLVREGCLRR